MDRHSSPVEGACVTPQIKGPIDEDTSILRRSADAVFLSTSDPIRVQLIPQTKPLCLIALDELINPRRCGSHDEEAPFRVEPGSDHSENNALRKKEAGDRLPSMSQTASQPYNNNQASP